MFLWTYAIWDVTYYMTLWATIRWPSSITDTDVLFLIPVVWVSPVWFPLLVSILSVGAVLLETTYPSSRLEDKARSGVSELKLDLPLKIVLQNC